MSQGASLAPDTYRGDASAFTDEQVTPVADTHGVMTAIWEGYTPASTCCRSEISHGEQRDPS